jgi:hypothetical protein
LLPPNAGEGKEARRRKAIHFSPLFIYFIIVLFFHQANQLNARPILRDPATARFSWT